MSHGYESDQDLDMDSILDSSDIVMRRYLFVLKCFYD